VFAARSNDVESVKVLLAAGADINQTTGYGWSPLLVATQNRYYKLGAFLLDHGADPNLANKGGWVPLYLATDNRNIESGDYPVRKGDMDHLDFIKLLLDKGAKVNARVKDSTETRTVFTNQWLDENGATAFFRASQSGDLTLMKLLLARGADPKIATNLNVTALHVAAGIGWVEGITYEWSQKDTLEAVRMLLDRGLLPDLERLVSGDELSTAPSAAPRSRLLEHIEANLLYYSTAIISAGDPAARHVALSKLRDPSGRALTDVVENTVIGRVGNAIALPLRSAGELPAQWRDALAAYQKAEIDKWWPIIKAAGIKAQ